MGEGSWKVETLACAHTGGALITQVLIPAVQIPNGIEMRPAEQNFRIGIKTNSVGLGWLLIFDLGHMKP